MSHPIAIIDNLTKVFDDTAKPALDHISTRIMPGKMTGIVGPDGAGKTTFLRLLVGLLKPSEGTIDIFNFNSMSDTHKIHEISGYMPQKFGLYEDLTVIENLELYAELRSLNDSQRKEKFKKLLDFTSLEEFQDRLAGNLSGGMKQKLGLACSLLGEPKILFLDEPSVGVDPISRRELWKMVKALLSDGISVLWSTSYLDEAEKCDTIILLNEGQKIYDGPPADLLESVKGRTWHVKGLKESERRNVLMELIQEKDVIDGIIQGSNIRILSKTNTYKPSLKKGKCQNIAPCFEDAFIDLLGGMSMHSSPLARQIQEKPFDDQPVIDAQGLTKKFDQFYAVKDNTFQIKRGEIFGLLGPNGAGKSTTFKMMCGLLQPTEGRALVKGLDLKLATSEARSKIGYMAQKFSLYGNLNVLQNLKFFSGLYGLSGAEQKHQIEMMIEIFSLKPHLKMNAQSLPLGFKQRLALACCVMHQPDILFLDEPTSGVDPITRREFWLHINQMVEKGITVMVTTHFMDEAEYCDRIGLIYKGENIATGTPDYLKSLAISADLPEPTLEDAFITLVALKDLESEKKAQV